MSAVPVSGEASRARLAGRLSRIAGATAGAVSVIGLAAPGIYRLDPEPIRATWAPNDTITLFIVVPLLFVSRRLADAGSSRGTLVWLATLHYLFYDFAFYLFGAALNALLPLYVVVVTLAAWCLALALTDARQLLALRFRAPPARVVGGWTLFLALGLTVTWTAQWLGVLLRTTPPGRFDATPELIRVVAAIDLSTMVGLLAPAAILLLRRRPAGLVLGTVLNASGALYNLVLVAGTLSQARLGVPGSGPLLGVWLVLFAGCAAAATRMLAAVDAAPARTSRTLVASADRAA